MNTLGLAELDTSAPFDLDVQAKLNALHCRLQSMLPFETFVEVYASLPKVESTVVKHWSQYPNFFIGRQFAVPGEDEPVVFVVGYHSETQLYVRSVLMHSHGVQSRYVVTLTEGTVTLCDQRLVDSKVASVYDPYIMLQVLQSLAARD